MRALTRSLKLVTIARSLKSHYGTHLTNRRNRGSNGQIRIENGACTIYLGILSRHIQNVYRILGLWLRLECSLDSLSIDSAHVIYVSEGYDVAYNRRTASQPSHVVLRVTWYVKTFQKRQLRVLNPARINVFYWFNWLNLIGS